MKMIKVISYMGLLHHQLKQLQKSIQIRILKRSFCFHFTKQDVDSGVKRARPSEKDHEGKHQDKETSLEEEAEEKQDSEQVTEDLDPNI